MELCDICASPRLGTRISILDVHEAVNRGFDPVSLNLLPSSNPSSNVQSNAPEPPRAPPQAREAWELALRSSTDWNICNTCMEHLGPFLPFATRSRMGSVAGTSGIHTPNDLAALVERKMRERGFAPEMQETALGSLKAPAESKAAEEKKGCFIATAACGPDAPEVATLRCFRDAVLADHRAGRALIGGYERVAPSLARWIEPWQTARWLVRTLLIRPVAWLVERFQT